MAGELFGREAEVAVLERLVADLVDGRGAMLVLEGAEGSGKSAMLAEATRLARLAGVGVLAARAAPASRGQRLAVLYELVGEDLPDDYAAPRHAWAALARLAGPGPLLTVVDDAEWLDPQSATVLRALSSESSRAPVLVVLARRCGGPSIPFVERRGVSSLRLGPLDTAAIEQLIQTSLPEADRATLSMCATEAGGNPLLAQELAALVAGASGPLQVADLVSLDLQRRLSSALAEHGPVAERTALAVAVLAPQARLDDIAALASCGMSEAAAALDWLVAIEVLTALADFRYAFAQPIAARSLLAGAGAARVGVLHDHAAERLIARESPTAEVAAQLLRAPPRGDSRRASILRDAGGLAVERGDPDEAVRLLRRALAEPPLPAHRAVMLVELGLALAHVDVAEGVEMLAVAVDASRPGLARAHAAEQLGQTLLAYAGRPVEAADAFAKALEELPPDHERRWDVELSFLNASREASTAGRGQRPQLEALVADGEGHAVTRRAALAELALETAMQGGDLREALGLARRALEGGVLLAGEMPNISAAYSAMSTLMWCGDYEGCVSSLDKLVTKATVAGSVGAEATARYCRARARLARGDVTGALRDSRRVLMLEREGSTLQRMITHAVMAGALLESGEPLVAAEILQRADGDVQASPAEMLFWLMASARVAFVQGRHDEACAAFARAGELASDAGCENPAIVPWRSGSALAHAARGRAAVARELVDEELARLRVFGGPPDALARALRVRASLVPATHGLHDLEEAGSLLEAFPPCLERIYTLLALGRARHRGGDRDGAVRALRSALQLAGSNGAAGAERDARAELSALGVRPRRTATSGVHALTPSERRVAELAATGLSNRDVALTLVVSPRTIEHHLTSVFRKLTINGREELPVALAAEPEVASD